MRQRIICVSDGKLFVAVGVTRVPNIGVVIPQFEFEAQIFLP
jgi:hypothetical protein